MTQLLDTFVTTFLAEQGRYETQATVGLNGPPWYSVWDDDASINDWVFHGTHDECTRWIAKQAARKAFGAMRGSYKRNNMVSDLLLSLAAEPETTSGDAG